MSEVDDFKECTSGMTPARRLSAFDQELVLRFFALKNRRARFKHEVTDFLTEYMEERIRWRRRRSTMRLRRRVFGVPSPPFAKRSGIWRSPSPTKPATS